MSLIAKRYARALFEVAATKNATDAVGADLASLCQVLAEPGVRAVVVNPDTPSRVRRASLDKLVEGKHELVRNVVQVILHRRREAVLPDLHEAYHAMLLASRNEVEGVVESAKPLDAETIAGFATRVEAAIGKKVKLESVIDESLIGGVRLRVGNTLWDASMATALDELERQLMQTTI